MKDGSMFGSLKKMLDEDFFMSHRKLYYDTLFEGYDVEVFFSIHDNNGLLLH